MQTIRNIGILAHVDAGKTTTTEHILFQSGRIKSLGRVDDGTAHTDWLEVERNRGISVKSAVTRLEWSNALVNLIDTPGHVDFSAEVERSLSVLDGVVLIVSAIDGVQAHTETLWRALQSLNMPTLIYVNKMDRVGIDLNSVMTELRDRLSPSIIPVQIPSGVGSEFRDVDSILDATPISPNPYGSRDAMLDTLHAALADHDEALLESYVLSLRPPIHQLIASLAHHTKLANTFPLVYGASLKGIGICQLLDAITTFLPPATSEITAPVSGVVFKIERDSTHGRAAFVRLFSGTLKNRDSIVNRTKQVEEKVNQIRQIDGHHYKDTGIVIAGDVAALYGLPSTRIGDVLGDAPPGRFDPKPLSIPLLTVQVTPTDNKDYAALVEALRELDAEDPALDLQWLPDDRELHIKVMGTIQLEVLQQMMLDRFDLAIQFGPPSVIYKETPNQPGIGFVAYTMPKPCWAILKFEIEPTAPGTGLSYSAKVRTEDLLQSYQNEVARRVPEALAQGLYGWEVTDLRITLVEGQHHVWHTHPLDFVIATPMAIMNGLCNTGVNLLEPILQFRIVAPDDHGGKILSDLATLRADFDNPVIKNGRFQVEGHVPLATSLEYPVQLSIQTGGRGFFSSRFLEYRKCPPDVKAVRTRRGVNPLDTAKYILWARSALS